MRSLLNGREKSFIIKLQRIYRGIYVKYVCWFVGDRLIRRLNYKCVCVWMCVYLDIYWRASHFKFQSHFYNFREIKKENQKNWNHFGASVAPFFFLRLTFSLHKLFSKSPPLSEEKKYNNNNHKSIHKHKHTMVNEYK